MSKLVNLVCTTLGPDVGLVHIYHTAVSASNLISSSISASLLTGSGINFTVEDDVTKFIAYSPSGICAGETGSITASVYSPNTRYLHFFTSGSDEGGTIEMTTPFTVDPIATDFTASVNFTVYSSATVEATAGTYPDDIFQGWYYSTTSSAPFATGSTLTLTLNTFTGSDDIYAFFKDGEL